ncbi:hypothetical protein HQ520_13330, partial [bacterium]|nr:hypothetical protein [bacterium]
LELAGGRVLVTHGHIVYPGVSPWRPGHRLIERLRGEARAALSQDRRETLSGELEAAALALEEYYADIKKWRTCRPFLSRLVGLPWWLARPDSLWRLIRARHGHPAQAATILEKFNLPARFLIIGHFHRSGVWPIGQRVVINTGHYGRHLGSPMRVVISENLLRCEQVREEVDGYKVGPETARFHLSGQNPDTQSEQEPSRFAKWRDEGDSHEAAL